MNVLDRLSPGFQAISAQFLAAGLDLTAILAKGPAGLKDHLESIKGSADVNAAVEAATKELQGQLTTAQSQLIAQTALVTETHSALQAAGIQPPSEASLAEALAKADTPAAKQKVRVDALASAITARASILAQEQLAKHGFQAGAALPVTPAADPSKAASAKDALTGRDRTVAAITASLARINTPAI